MNLKTTKRLAVAVTATSLVAASLSTATTAEAYPHCYYAYDGCYLNPGWYGGRYWDGGYWWGWNSRGWGPPINSCPVPYETGACGPTP